MRSTITVKCAKAVVILALAVTLSACAADISSEMEYNMVEFCAHKWPDDERMQDRCVEDQKQDYRSFKERDADIRNNRGEYADSDLKFVALQASLDCMRENETNDGLTDWHGVERCVRSAEVDFITSRNRAPKRKREREEAAGQDEP